MTQTLMDFLQIVTPAPTGRCTDNSADVTPVDVALDQGRAQMEDRLSRLNNSIRNMGCDGRLIAVPLCPSACKPGSLAAFILSLNTDPFERWNMMFYASNATTARLLDTLPYHPDYATDTNALMVDYLNGLHKKRDNHITTTPDQDTEAMNLYSARMRNRLIEDCRQIELTLFGARRRLWQLQPDGTDAAASPPSAVINAAMSAGTGTENRM